MNSYIENVIQAISDFDDVVSSLEEKNVFVPENTPTSEYGNLIRGLDVSSDSIETYTVRILDYDGTVLKTIIAKEGDNILSSLPTITDKEATNLRPALTYQGLNYPNSAFESVQADIDAGAIYVPSDGKTHVYLRLTQVSGLAIPLYLTKSGTSLMTIDWGDGTTSTSSASETITFTSNYTAIGLKHITITGTNYYLGTGVASTAFVGGTTQVYRDALISCFIGSGCTYLLAYSMYYNRSLQNITLRNGLLITGIYHFGEDYSLNHISIPSSITVLPNYFILRSYALKSISLPYELSEVNIRCFDNCSALEKICLGNTVTNILEAAFNACSSLKKIEIPASVHTIGNNIASDCPSLSEIRIYPSSYLSMGVSCFSSNQCPNFFIDTILPIYFTTGHMFSNCLTIDDSIQPPDGTTAIAVNTFVNNRKRTFFNIPSSVNSIASGAFQNCSGLKYIIFNSTTPPSLENVNALSGHPTSCIYFVPDASLSAYQTATNWATYANQIRPLSEFNINDF